jgi:hypothetical protein
VSLADKKSIKQQNLVPPLNYNNFDTFGSNRIPARRRTIHRHAQSLFVISSHQQSIESIQRFFVTFFPIREQGA